jgi:peptide/nickel transport system substrate-binding protein
MLLVLLLSMVLAACGDPTATTAPATTTAAATTAAAATTTAGAATTTSGAATTAAATTTAGAATTTAAAATTSAGASLDRVVIVQGTEPDTLDPQNHNFTTSFNVLNNIYDSLVEFDRNVKIQPRLAESWRQVDDLTLEFKLRKGVKWHDGTDFTAEDVKFNNDRIAESFAKETDPVKRLKRSSTWTLLKEAKVIDANTVQLITKEPAPTLLARLTGEHIISKKFVTEKGNEFVGVNAMGTGPYKFVEWKKAQYVDVEANDGWFNGAPKVKKIRFRPIADAQTRVAALQAGEVDIITDVTPEVAKQLETARTTVSSIPGGRTIFIILNTLDDTPVPALKDKRVRQALNYAVDRDAILQSILLGNGAKVPGPINKYYFAYEELPMYNYDPAKAKQLLTEAGYPNGFEIALNVPNNRYLKDKEMGEAVAEYWKNIGVKVTFTNEPFATYVTKVDNRKQTPAFLLGWLVNTFDPDGTLYDQFYTGQRYNYYNNPEFNKLVEQSRVTVDTKKREELLKQAVRIIHQDAPWLFMFQQQDIYGVSKKIKWTGRVDQQLNAWEIQPA